MIISQITKFFLKKVIKKEKNLSFSGVFAIFLIKIAVFSIFFCKFATKMTNYSI